MNIKFENIDKVSALITVNITAEDYEESVGKSLKDYRRKAQMRGFRPGCVPMSIVKRLYGPAVKAEEISKTVSKGIEDYLQNNKIGILGHILENKDQKQQDFENGSNFEFLFDVALAPEFDIELTTSDKLPYYDITVSDDDIDKRVKDYAMQRGKFETTENYEKGAYLKGNLVELAPAEGAEPLTVAEVLVSPEYIANEEQKKLFDGAKTGDVITINPAAMYDGEAQTAAMLKIKVEELEQHKGDFTYTITEINHRVPAEINQELFDTIFEKGTVTTEQDFRVKIRERMEKNNAVNSDYKFLMDLKDYAMKTVDTIKYSEPLLKRLMKENNADKDDKYINDNYPQAVEQLKWQEIRNKLATQAEIKVNDDDIKEAARRNTREQFAQYGMVLPDEVLEKYATESLKKGEQVERLIGDVIDAKLINAYKEKVTLEHKTVTYEEFDKLLELK